MTEPKDRQTGSSRRRHRRVEARGVTASVRGDDFEASVPVVNISTGGMLVGGGHQVPRDVPLRIELTLKGLASLSLAGRALYSVTDGVGVAFAPLTIEVAAQLEKLISAVDAKNALPPPLPTRRATAEADLSAAVPRDAFAPVGDPKPPRSGSADDRAEYLRTLVKNRDEANARGHAALAALAAENEAQRLKLEAATTQHRLSEAALASAREAAQATANAHAAKIEEEKHRTREAFASASGLEAKLRHLQGELEAARAEARAKAADIAALNHLHDDLVRERAKVVEADRALLSSDQAYEAAEAARLKAVAEVEVLKARLEEFESSRLDVTRIAMAPAPPPSKRRSKSDDTDTSKTASHTAFEPGGDSKALAEAVAERDKARQRCEELEAEVAKFKRRLIAAENALEARANKKPPAPAGRAKGK